MILVLGCPQLLVDVTQVTHNLQTAQVAIQDSHESNIWPEGQVTPYNNIKCLVTTPLRDLLARPNAPAALVGRDPAISVALLPNPLR